MSADVLVTLPDSGQATLEALTPPGQRWLRERVEMRSDLVEIDRLVVAAWAAGAVAAGLDVTLVEPLPLPVAA